MLPSNALSRRAVLVAGALAVMGTPKQASAARRSTLFAIGRSLNTNVIHYDANLREDGWFDADEPLLAYWVMHAEGRRREALSWFEWQFAYGFEIVSKLERDRFSVRLTALSGANAATGVAVSEHIRPA